MANSNYKKRDGDDSFEEMKKHAKKMNYRFPYLLDEKSELANAFGAKTTPHFFLFNSKDQLVYKGAIDDNYKDIKITKLAKGLASGTDLEYSDFNTLSNAFENRTNIN